MFDSYHLKLKHPFTALVAGSTGSGKTVLVRRILKNYMLTTTITSNRLRVLYFYGQVQTMFAEPVAANVDIRYVHVKGSDDFDDSLIRKERPDVVVVDDLMNELGGNATLASLFTRGSHHIGFSVIFIVQNVFHKGREVRNLSLNSHYMFLLKNARDKSQIDHLARQISPANVQGFREVFADATKEPYSYLMIDFKPDTPDELRYRARITPEDKVKGSPKGSQIVYQVPESRRR